MTAREARIRAHIEKLCNGDVVARRRAERWLFRYGQDAVPLLAKACKFGSPQTRAHAVWVLGLIGGPEAFDAILTLSHDPDEQVRYDARWALGLTHDPRAADILFGLAESCDADDVGSEWYGIRELGPTVLERLLDLSLGPDQKLAVPSIYELGQTGDPKALPVLAEALRSEDSRRRLAAVEALGVIGGNDALGLLQTALDDPDDQVRSSAQLSFEEAAATIPGPPNT